MLIKTVVDEDSENAKLYESYCRADESEDFRDIQLILAEVEYDDAFAESLSRIAAQYHLHTIYTHDYESSSDAGDGRDDFYREEADVPVEVTACIVKDSQLFGVMCECFDRQRFLLLDYPETIISHPGNYAGRNYHFYRNQRFKLIRNV